MQVLVINVHMKWGIYQPNTIAISAMYTRDNISGR